MQTARELIELLRRERIVSDAELQKAERFTAQLPSAAKLGERLRQEGILTAFQLDAIQRGKAAELILRDYLLLELLGEGGMGKVYKARHRIMDRVVGLKVVRPEVLDSSQAVKRFEREMQVAAKVDHPNIVRALDAGHVGETYFYVMEYIEGIDLARLVHEEGPLPVALACDFARQVALGLQHLHERGMVHRDIKPQNLMAVLSKTRGNLKERSSFDGVKILDLGLALFRHPEADSKTLLRLTRVGAVMGTPDFMAPEQTTDTHKVDIRADLYSLGCTLYYLLTADMLFHAGSAAQKLAQHRAVPAPNVRQLRPEVPEGLARVLEVLLAKKPEERYGTPREAAAALAPYCGEAVKAGDGQSEETRSAQVKARPPVPTPRQRVAAPATRVALNEGKVVAGHRWAWVLGGAGMFAAGLAVMLFSMFRGDATPNKGADGEKPPELVIIAKKVEDATPPRGKGFVNSLAMKFAWVPPGESWLGGSDGTEGTTSFSLKEGLWCGIYEVTQEEWEAVMSVNPSHFKGNPRNPVEKVSWDDAQEFIKKLNEKLAKEGVVYRLPTEEQWEYICRGGPILKENSKYSFYFAKSKTDLTANPTNDLSSAQANVNGLYPAGSAAKGLHLQRPSEVGSHLPNPLGIFDLHGNVWEWTETVSGSDRVIRGGSWYDRGEYCTAAFRTSKFPPDKTGYNLGFRLLAVPSGAVKLDKAVAPIAKKPEEPKEKTPPDLVKTAKDELPPPGKGFVNSLGMKLVWIAPGRFQMGSPIGESDRSDNELQHEVEISQGFYMGAFEVTQDQYRQVMGADPSHFNAVQVGMNTDDFPVERVSWDDTMEFCRKLTEKEKDAGRVYDLPTEAEWEYACRAGTKSVFAFGDSLGSAQVNFNGEFPYGGAAKGPYLKRTGKVGGCLPNAWGLYDVHGNVWEWCKDWYGKDYYRESSGEDPLGPATGTSRVLRGGSLYDTAGVCRSARRNGITPDRCESGIGFRVVVRLSPGTKKKKD